MIKILEDELKNKLHIVHEIVKDEDEPYKLEAFKIILSSIIGSSSITKSVVPIDSDSLATDLMVMTQLAQQCNLDVDKLKNILDYTDGKFHLYKKINETTDVRKQIVVCQIIVTAYMKGMNQEWVSGSDLREHVEKNSAGNVKNVAKNLTQSGLFRFRGEKKNSEYSLTTEGWQQGLNLIRQLSENTQ